MFDEAADCKRTEPEPPGPAGTGTVRDRELRELSEETAEAVPHRDAGILPEQHRRGAHRRPPQGAADLRRDHPQRGGIHPYVGRPRRRRKGHLHPGGGGAHLQHLRPRVLPPRFPHRPPRKRQHHRLRTGVLPAGGGELCQHDLRKGRVRCRLKPVPRSE